MRFVRVTSFVFLAACGAASAPVTQPGPSAGSPVHPASSGGGAHVSAPRSASVSPGGAAERPAPAPPPSGNLTLAEARRYMVQLINRDRATAGLPAVTLDDGPATVAGQAHADDMARLGYLGHWGSDGSVPEQRYSEAGGRDIVFENAFCVTDEKKRPLDASPRFSAADIERAEAMFFDEVPPNDGHRKNILGRFRRRVGIGIAVAKFDHEIPMPCIAQEFVESFGTYGEMPRGVRLGSKLHVAGTLGGEVKVGGVGVARIEEPRPLPAAELNKRRVYPMPNTYAMYWPAGFRTPIEVNVHGQSFDIDVPMTDGGRKGLYEVSVWAKRPGDKDFAPVSLRTLRVD